MGSIFEREFGLKPIVNCIGNFTSLGGSRMHPDAVEAAHEASFSFVDMNALYRAAGEKVAQMTGQPGTHTAHITTGAAAAISMCTAALLTGLNEALVHQLPDITGIDRHEVILDGHDTHDGHTRWQQAIKLTGAKVVLAGSKNNPMTADTLKAKLASGRVMLVLYFENGEATREANGQMRFEDVIEISHAAGAMVGIDAAARIPPAANLSRFTKMGADAAIFSGGKHMRGPQTSGVLFARREIIDAVRLNGSPNEETICRGMKVAKEDVVAFVAALRALLAEEGERGGQMAGYEAAVERMRKSFSAVNGVVAARRVCPGDPSIQPNDIPRLYVDIISPAPADGPIQMTSVDHGSPLEIKPLDPPTALSHALVNGEPRIAALPSETGIIINPQTMSIEDETVLLQRVTDILNSGVCMALGDNAKL
jgi:L-seryl-tRNA(Ser) seleniumtransferase